MQNQSRLQMRDLYVAGEPLARKLAQKYANASHGRFEDFYGYALEGLALAIRRYDTHKSNGSKFTSFAYLHIRGQIINQFRRSSPVPHRVQNLFFRGNALRKKFSLVDKQISDRLKISEEQWQNCCAAMHYYFYRLHNYEVSYLESMGRARYSVESIPSLHNLLTCFGFDKNWTPRSPKWNHSPLISGDQVLALREEGYSLMEISAILEASFETVRGKAAEYQVSSWQNCKRTRTTIRQRYVAMIVRVIERRGITKVQCANEIGVHKAVLHQWISGRNCLSRHSIEKIQAWIEGLPDQN